MKVGSLFSGYGGLDLAIQSLWPDAHPAWFVEFDKHPSAILARHWPNVPNYGDITAVDWAAVEPVDILTGGYPCQPFSHAGNRKGTNDERHLFPYVADAIGVLRPRLVFLENVYGHLSLGGTAVIAALAGLGYDARWGVVRASDAGAAHRRARLFIVAAPADESGDRWGEGWPGSGEWAGGGGLPAGDSADPAAYPHGERCDGSGLGGTGGGAKPSDRHSGAVTALLPTPTSRDHKGHNQRGDASCLPGALLPTPAVNDMGAGKTVQQWDEWAARQKASDGRSAPHGKSLSVEALRLLPTPTAQDAASSSGANPAWGHGITITDAARNTVQDWGIYTAAIRRGETFIGRPAPDPTEPDTNGKPRLSRRFDEWLMGLPEGWVTDCGIPYGAQLKALGNGVVPQQAALALRMLLGGDA